MEILIHILVIKIFLTFIKKFRIIKQKEIKGEKYMAKVAFSKLGLKVNQDIKTIEFNGQNIEVKQYLPIQDKLRLISNIIN